MPDLRLIMPMAGKGSRFQRDGIAVPKPLIELAGRPFFWWAIESVCKAATVSELVCVVLAEHIASHGMDVAIQRYFPNARLVVLDEPTAGAAETAAVGIAALKSDGPIAVNDCDHAFAVAGFTRLIEGLAGTAAGALVGFASADPAYSYIRFDDQQGRVTGTVEKRCAGPFAIAGCYLFRDKATFGRAYESYRKACPYPELFLSGVYNQLCESGEQVLFAPLDAHISFGTPLEAAAVTPGALAALLGARDVA